MTLNSREINKVLESRAKPPRVANLSRKTGPPLPPSMNGASSDKRKKKQALASLLKDKSITAELIRLYSNNAELRDSQKKLAQAKAGSRDMRTIQRRNSNSRDSRNVSNQKQ